MASLVHVGEFLHGFVFLNQIKSASELHLPGDRGCFRDDGGSLHPPGGLLSRTQGAPSSLLWLVVSGLQGARKRGGLLLLGQRRTQQSMPKLEALGPQAESPYMCLSAIH